MLNEEYDNTFETFEILELNDSNKNLDSEVKDVDEVEKNIEMNKEVNIKLYYETLDEHCENLERYSDEILTLYNQIKKNYENLTLDYNNLKKEHEELKYEYSENTIIQSMNDMKNRYEELIRNTVSLVKYNTLEEKYNKLARNCISSITMIDRVYKYLRRIEDNPFYRDAPDFRKIELEMTIISEILQDGLPKKIEF